MPANFSKNDFQTFGTPYHGKSPVTSGSAIPSGKNMAASFFDEADANNDGHLTKDEVKEVQSKRMKGPGAKDLLKKMNTTEEQKKKIEHAAVNGFVAKTDKDKDGKITKKEFGNWLKKNRENNEGFSEFG